MVRSLGTRPGITVVGRARSDTEALGDLTQRVAWMIARGWRSDTIERLIASWMREGGAGPEDAGRVAKATIPSLSWRQMRLVAGRLDRFARRPDPGPEQTEPLHEPRPWITRDDSWFASLRTRASDAGIGLARLGITRPERGPSNLGVHLRERVARSPLAPFAPFGVGGLEAAPRVAIPAGLAPGIYALQARASDHLAVGAGPSPQSVLARLGAGRPLSLDLRGELSERMATLGRPLDLDTVLVHEGAAADGLCREMRAEAFAIGRHVVFAAGRFHPDDTAGMGLLAHELAHVWQQSRGLVTGSDHVVANSRLEADAERFGRALSELGPLGRASARDAARPAPRAASLDGLVTETRAFVRSQRSRPAAIFIVTDRITAYDASFRALGAWRITGPCPLQRGYWLDGGVGSAAWSTLSTADRARLTGGRSDDLWVIGGRVDATAAPRASAGDRDDLRAFARMGAAAIRTAFVATDLGREVDDLLAALLGPTADGGMASATTPAVSIPRFDGRRAHGPVIDDDPRRAALTRSLAADAASQLGLSSFRVRVDASAAALTATHGTDGVMLDGTAWLDPAAFDPTTSAGRALLAHELVHVAQALLPRPSGARAEALAEAEAEALEAGRRFAAGGRIAPAKRPLPAGHVPTGLAEDTQVKELFKAFFNVSGLKDDGGGLWTGKGGLAVVAGSFLENAGEFALTAKLKDEPGGAEGWQRWEWAKAEKTIAPFGDEAGALLIESINTGETQRVDVTVSFRDLELPGLAPIPELDLKAQGVTDGKALSALSVKAKGQVDLDTSGLIGKLVQRAHVLDPSFDIGAGRLNATGEAVLKLPGIEANKGEFKIVDNVVSGTFDFASKRFGVPSEEPIVDGEVHGRLTIADNKFADATLQATTGIAIQGVPEDDDLVVWDLEVKGDGATDFRGKLTKPVTFAWVLPQSPIEDLVLSELDGQIVKGSEGATSLKLHSRVDLVHSKTRLDAHVVEDNSFVFDYDTTASTKLTLSAQDPLVVHLLGTKGPHKLDVVAEGLRFAGPSLKEGTLSFSSGSVTGKLPIAGQLGGALLQTDSLREINADLSLATDIMLPSEDAPLLAGRADSALQVRKGKLKEGKVGATLVLALPGGLEPVRLKAHLEVDEQQAISAGVQVAEPLVLVKERLTLLHARLDRAQNGDLDGDLGFHVGPDEQGWDVEERFDKSKGITSTPAEAKQAKESTDAAAPYDYTLKVGFSLSQGFYAEGRFGANLGPLRIEGMGRISQLMLLGRGADLQFGFVGDLSKPLSFKKTLLKAPKKKIPIIAWGGLAGLFAEAGADIAVQAQAGSIGVDGGGTIQGLKPWGPFADKATAKVNVQGSAQGSLVGGPTLGIGAWVSGGLLSVSGGLRMPLTATLVANLSTAANITLTPEGVSGDVAVAAPLLFSMGGAAIPYFDFKALGGAIKSNKEGKPLAELTLVEPTKVLDFGVSLSDLLKPAEASAPAEIDTSAEVSLGDAAEVDAKPPTKPVPSQGTVAPLTEAPSETPTEDFDTTKLWEGLKDEVGEEAWYKRVDTLRVLLEKVGSLISVATDALDKFVKWLSDHVKLDLASVGDTFWDNIQSFTESFSGSSYLDVVKLVRTIWKGREAEEGSVESSSAAVDLNGDVEALEGKLVELPGIGPAKAKAIKEHRVAIGRFKDKRELLDVPGIGQKTYEKIEAKVVIGVSGESGERPSTKLDINGATAKDLEKIDGIGPKLAAAIVEYRATMTDGRFTTIEQLLGVPGIGPARLEKLKEAVQIGSEVGPDTSVSLGQLDLTMGSARLRAQVLSTQPLKVWFPAAANTLRDDLILQEFQGADLTGDADGVEGVIIGSLFTKGLGTFDGMKLPVSGKTMKPEFQGVPFRKGELLAELPVPEALSGKLANLPNAVTEITIEQKPAGAELPATIGGVKLTTDKPISTIFDRPDGETWRLKGLDGIAFGGDDSYFMARLLDAEWAEQTGFSGSGELAARLGSVGAAAGQVTIKNNKLESVKLGLDSATVGFPKAAPLVTAQVMGHLEIGPEHDTSAQIEVLATLPKLPSAPTVKAAIKFDKDWNPQWKAGLEAPVSIMSGVTLLSLSFGEADKKFWASGAGYIDLAGVHIATSVSYAAETGLAFSVVGDVGVPGLELTSLSGGYGPGGLSLGGGARFTKIPGFEPLDASFSLSGKRVTFTTKPVEQKAEGSDTRSKLKLTLQDFGYDMGARVFTGAGGLEGILPVVGLVRGHFEIGDGGEVKESPPKPPPESSDPTPSTPEVSVSEGGFGERIKVTKGHLEVVNDRLRIPDAKPFVWGQIDASLDYEDGKVDGAMKAKGMRLDIPGMGTRALTLEGSIVDNVYAAKVGLGPETKKRPASWISLKSFGGGYDGKRSEDPWSFNGALGVSLGATESTMDVKYGAGALSATGTVDFGKKDPKSRFWGTVTASYDSGKEPAFGFSGSITAKLGDNLEGTATLAYNDKAGDPDNPGGVDLGLSLNPASIVDGRSSPKTLAGPYRLDFPLAAFPPVPITLFGSLGGQIDLDYGSKSGVSIGGTADIKGIHRSPEEDGGLTFDSAEVRPKVTGDLFAELAGGPSIGIGAALLLPKLASIQGTLGIPLKLTATATPTLEGSLRYKQGELDGGAAISAPLTMAAAIEPTLSLDTMLLGFPKKWGSIALGKWPLMKPKKLFDFYYELGRLNAPVPAIEPPTSGQLEDAPTAPEPTNEKTSVPDQKVEAKDATPGGSLAGAQGGTFDLVGLKDKAVGKLSAVTEWIADKWNLVANLGKAVWNKAKEFASTCGNWLKVGADYATRLGSWARFWRGGADRALEEAESSRYEIYNQPDLKEYEGFSEEEFLKDGTVQSKIGLKARERYQDQMSAMKEWDEYSWGFIPVGSVVRFFGSGGAKHEQQAKEQKQIAETAEEVRQRYADPIAQAKRALEESGDQSPEMSVFYRFMTVAGRAPLPAALPVLMRGYEVVRKSPSPVSDALMEMGESDIGWLFWSEGAEHDVAVAVDYLMTAEHRRAHWFQRFLYTCPTKKRGDMEKLLKPMVSGLAAEILRHRRAVEKTVLSTDSSGHITASTEERRVAKFEEWALVKVDKSLDQFDALPKLTSEQEEFRALLNTLRDVSPGQDVMQALLGAMPYVIDPERGSWRVHVASEKPVRRALQESAIGAEIWNVLANNEASERLVDYLRDDEKCAAHHIRQALEPSLYTLDDEDWRWGRIVRPVEDRFESGISGVRRETRITRGISKTIVLRFDEARDRYAALESPSEEQRTFMAFAEQVADLGASGPIMSALVSGASAVLGGKDGAWRKWAAGRPMKDALLACGDNGAPIWSGLAGSSGWRLVSYLKDYESFGARDFRQVLTAGGKLKTAAAAKVQDQVSGLESEIAGWKRAADKHSGKQIEKVDDIMDAFDKIESLSGKQLAFKTWLRIELEQKICKGALDTMIDGAGDVLDPEQASVAGPRIAYLYSKEDSGAWDFVRTGGGGGELSALADYCLKVEKNGARFEELMLTMIPQYSTWSGRQSQAATNVYNRTGLGSMRRYM